MIREIIQEFNIKQNLESIFKHIEEHFKTIKESYKGFYCALCSKTFHKSVDINNRSISLTPGFCDWLARESIGFLGFFGQYFQNIYEILYLLENSCDSMDRFTFKQTEMFFGQKSPINKTDIQNCIFSISKGTSTPGCDFICKAYSPFRIDDFFLPNFFSIERIVKDFYLKENYIDFNKESQNLIKPLSREQFRKLFKELGKTRFNWVYSQ